MTIFFYRSYKYIFNVIGLLGNAIIYIDMNCVQLSDFHLTWCILDSQKPFFVTVDGLINIWAYYFPFIIFLSVA